MIMLIAVFLIVFLMILLPFLIWKVFISKTLKYEIILWYGLGIAMIFLIMWFKFSANQVEDFFHSVEVYKNEVVNDVKNPLGVEDLLYVYRLSYSRERGENQKDEIIGNVLVYKVSEEVSEKIINSNGKYLNEYLQNFLKISYNTNNYSIKYKQYMVDDKKECNIPLQEYVWEPIKNYSRFFYKYSKRQVMTAHRNEYYNVKYMFKDIEYYSISVNGSNFIDESVVYPVFLSFKKYSTILNDLSDKSYYFVNYVKGFDDKVYIYDPVNRWFIVSVAAVTNPISCSLK